MLLRIDFRQVGSASRVSRCLRILCTFGVLMRLWTWLCPKTWVTGKRIPRGSLEMRSLQALERLGTCCPSGPPPHRWLQGSLGHPHHGAAAHQGNYPAWLDWEPSIPLRQDSSRRLRVGSVSSECISYLSGQNLSISACRKWNGDSDWFVRPSRLRSKCCLHQCDG